MATVIPLCGVWAGRAQGAVPAAVVGDRFRIWQGRSGRRHVFTRIEDDCDAADLDGAVVMVARRGADGVVVAERVMLAADPMGVAPGRELWAHFLAESDAERAGVMADLAPIRSMAILSEPDMPRAA